MNNNNLELMPTRRIRFRVYPRTTTTTIFLRFKFYASQACVQHLVVPPSSILAVGIRLACNRAL